MLGNSGSDQFEFEFDATERQVHGLTVDYLLTQRAFAGESVRITRSRPDGRGPLGSANVPGPGHGAAAPAERRCAEAAAGRQRLVRLLGPVIRVPIEPCISFTSTAEELAEAVEHDDLLRLLAISDGLTDADSATVTAGRTEVVDLWVRTTGWVDVRPVGPLARRCAKQFKQWEDVLSKLCLDLLDGGYAGSSMNHCCKQVTNNYLAAMGPSSIDGSMPVSHANETHVPAQVDAVVLQLAIQEAMARRCSADVTVDHVLGSDNDLPEWVLGLPAADVLSAVNFKSAHVTGTRLGLRAGVTTRPLGPEDLEQAALALRRAIRSHPTGRVIQVVPRLASDVEGLPNSAVLLATPLHRVVTEARRGGQERVVGLGFPTTVATLLCTSLAGGIDTLPATLGDSLRVPDSLFFTAEVLRKLTHSYDPYRFADEDEDDAAAVDLDSILGEVRGEDSTTERREPGSAGDHPAAVPSIEMEPSRFLDDPSGRVKAWLKIADDLPAANCMDERNRFIDLLLGCETSMHGFSDYAEGLLSGTALRALISLAETSTDLGAWQRSMQQVIRVVRAGDNLPTRERRTRLDVAALVMPATVVENPDTGRLTERDGPVLEGADRSDGVAGAVDGGGEEVDLSTTVGLRALELPVADGRLVEALSTLSGRIPSDLLVPVLELLRYANSYKRLRRLSRMDVPFDPPTAA